MKKLQAITNVSLNYTGLIVYPGKFDRILLVLMQFRVFIFKRQFTFVDAISFKRERVR